MQRVCILHLDTDMLNEMEKSLAAVYEPTHTKWLYVRMYIATYVYIHTCLPYHDTKHTCSEHKIEGKDGRKVKRKEERWEI